ncbi:MAG: DUF4845 domain-containing protein [Methylococcales bacterium]
MKSSAKRQQGLTFISILLILGLIAFFVLLIFKVVPIYLDHSKVANALAEIKAMPDATTKSEAEIRKGLDRQFIMNYVYDVTQEDIKVVKHGTYLKVQIEYEVVKKLAGNLSLLAEFNDVIEVGQE